jgi:hypothetical protein
VAGDRKGKEQRAESRACAHGRTWTTVITVKDGHTIGVTHGVSEARSVTLSSATSESAPSDDVQ